MGLSFSSVRGGGVSLAHSHKLRYCSYKHVATLS
jgi:hypothetical protein